MIPLLAVDDLVAAASGAVVIPAWAMVAALLSVVSAFVALGLKLLAEKDSKLTLAREFGKDFSDDKEKTRAVLDRLVAEIKHTAEALESALNERDSIVKDGMDLMRSIQTDVAALARERKP